MNKLPSRLMTANRLRRRLKKRHSHVLEPVVREEFLHEPRQPKSAVELFAGAGGLAMGMAKAGFLHRAVVEVDDDCCRSLLLNKSRGLPLLRDWSIQQNDVRQIDYSNFSGQVDVVSGGPPCQPFSLGGKHRGYHDNRDMFPEAIRAVRQLRPKAFIFENVKGLLRQSFARYFEYIALQLQYPSIEKKPHESWEDHLARLERHHTRGYQSQPEYRIVYRLLNAADYGVPQRRERVIIVGFREDLGVAWNFPPPTHSQEALAWTQLQSMEYWERHGIARVYRDSLIGAMRQKRQKIRECPALKPWNTVRDVLADLPEPTDIESKHFYNHRFMAGAKVYPGHTGSPLDEPAKTLKAGDHGVPGGENMLARPDGSVRYFTIRESARLQTFPDDFVFTGSWTESMRQLGNAVPVELASRIASSIHDHLELAS